MVAGRAGLVGRLLHCMSGHVESVMVVVVVGVVVVVVVVVFLALLSFVRR